MATNERIPSIKLPRALDAVDRPEDRSGILGVGVITMNRLDALKQCVARIQRHTASPYVLVIADDGSSDGTVEWAHSVGIPVVTGERRGCAWNKNRALYFLRQCTDCDPIILLEDDTWPVRDGWERVWIEAGHRWHHVNFDGSSYNEGLDPDDRPREPGTAERPYVTPHITGVCTVTSRVALDEVGYLDTRFRGYGIEHVEWTRRFATRYADLWGVPMERYPALNHGVLMAHAGGSAFDIVEVNKNHAIYTEMLKNPDREGLRPPWRNDEEWLTLGLEVAVGQQVFAAKGAATSEPEANDVGAAASSCPKQEDDPDLVLAGVRQVLPRIGEALRFPNGPQLWFFTDGSSPERALLSLVGIVLNGYAPSGITLFGSHHWDERARDVFAVHAPFTTTAPSDIVFATISAAGGEELAGWARQHIEIERALAPLTYPIDACCVATDDVFVIEGIDDALRSARQKDLVFVAANGQPSDDEMSWPWVAPGRPSASTQAFASGLYWIRRFADPQVVGRLAARQSPKPEDPSVWANSLIATLYASRQTEALPETRYVRLPTLVDASEVSAQGGSSGASGVELARDVAVLITGPAAREFDDAQLAAIRTAVLDDAIASPAADAGATATRAFDFSQHSAWRATVATGRHRKRGKGSYGSRRDYQQHDRRSEGEGRQPLSVTVRGQSFDVWPSPVVTGFWDHVNNGEWETDTFAVLDRLVSRGSVYVDCGAWIGPTVLFAASKGATVTAFECDPAALESLTANIELNPKIARRIEIVEAALGDRDGIRVLHAFTFGDSQATIFDTVERGGQSFQPGNLVTVTGQDAGRLFDRRGWLDDTNALIKIDTEGAEYPILTSFGSRIATARCSFYISFHPINLVGGDRRPDRLVRQRATLNWIDQFWDYDWWWAPTGTGLVPTDKQHFLNVALAGDPLPAILFSRRDDLRITTH